ncbi:MAG: hypothetical protein LQ343_000795 [Gyalolechia ehrenbergii]|nr:MAG: hypothetical protein LQ343_000795 [Gyalolechia ehrenbergii]
MEKTIFRPVIRIPATLQDKVGSVTAKDISKLRRAIMRRVATGSAGNAVDCTGSSECAQENVDLNKTCTTFKITEEGSLKATFELKLPQWIEGWNPSFDFHKITSENNLATEEVCTTTSSRGYVAKPL